MGLSVEKARKKGLDILRQVSKHTLPFIFRYFAIYVDILFLGYSIAQFSIFSLSSDILNVISISHLQAATLHYSTHP